MESTLVAMTKKKRRVRMRESTADEWIEIVKLAKKERLEYCATVIQKVVDDQAAEETETELNDGIQFERSTSVIAKRKRTPRFVKTFGNMSKERLSFGTD